MVKCDACLLTNDVRYVKPPGKCESCHVVTPYQDKLCASCSDSQQRCQCCRSKRVTALVSVPAATQPLVEALAAHRETVIQQASSYSSANTPRDSPFAQQEEKQQTQSVRSSPVPSSRISAAPFSTPNFPLSTAAAAHPSDLTASAAPMTMGAALSPRSQSFLATSPFHYQNAMTYPLPADMNADLSSAFNLSSSGSGAVPMIQPPQQQLISVPAHSPRHHHQTAVAVATDMLQSQSSVILSPSGKLLPSTLTPLSPRMAVKQNAAGQAPHIRDGGDAFALVESWTKAELVSTLFHYYCNHKSSKLTTMLGIGKFRHFAFDAGLVGPADPSTGASALGSNRLDILFTSCTRPLSGQKSKMNEDQFFECLGSIALFLYGGGASQAHKETSRLVECLDKLFLLKLTPLAVEIVQARRGGLFLRGEEFDSIVSSVLLRYEEPLKKIFVRKARESYHDFPRADEVLSHPLLEDGWRSFCREYDFFPSNVSASAVLQIFISSATGMVRSGNLDVMAMSMDDFMHGLFQLAQIGFTLTPNALPIERVELLLNKIDLKAREIHYVPIAHRARLDAQAETANSLKLLTAGSDGDEDQQMIPYKGADGKLVAKPNPDAAYSALHGLFTEAHMGCARDLFNLYCNNASQSSYSEMMPRLAWVKLFRESRLIDGRNVTGADGDILFNKILTSKHHAQGDSTTSTLFQGGRFMNFNDFLQGLLDLSSKKFPSLAATASLRSIFMDHFEPLLLFKISELQERQANIALPLGAGLNSTGVLNENPGNWGSREEKYVQGGAPGATLYPNHPAADATQIDAAVLIQTDPALQSLFSTYGKALEKIFFKASWEGIEAVNGVAIPRISSSLLVHPAPHVALQNQVSWDQFLQSKELLSENSFRRWLSQIKIVPDLLAHKQVTMLFRVGNIGFDRAQNQFVLNSQEFRQTLLRIALLCFCGVGYDASYPSPAAKLELLFFLIDQNSAGAMQFKGFKFNVQTHTQGSAAGYNQAVSAGVAESNLLMSATNMGKNLWERKASSELGVRALLEGSRTPSVSTVDNADLNLVLPQNSGHGVKSSRISIASAAHSMIPLGNFNTSMQTPRALFATPFRPPSPERNVAAAANASSASEPIVSPTRHLFQQTPFSTKELSATKFASNVPGFALQGLKNPRGAQR